MLWWLKFQSPLLNNCPFHKIRAQRVKLKRYLFEWGNKPGRMLAKALRVARAQLYIAKVHSKDGRALYLSNDIAQRFREYYQALQTRVERGPLHCRGI